MERMKKLLSNRRGQNTVEYLLILAVVVAVVLGVGGLLKSYAPQLTQKVTGMMDAAATKLNSN